MKKVFLFGFLLTLVFAFAGCGKKTEGPKVKVTVVTSGTLQLALREVTVTDGDGDGSYTVLEAIRSAHEAYASEEQSFAVEDTDFGKDISCLWGEECGGGDCGIYANHESVYDISSPVEEGDLITVFTYADKANASDVYAYFDPAEASAEGGKIRLTLTLVTMDLNWNPVKSPLAGAVLTVDGEETEYVTDENGLVTLSLTGSGEKLISALCDAYVLIPPVARITVSE